MLSKSAAWASAIVLCAVVPAPADTKIATHQCDVKLFIQVDEAASMPAGLGAALLAHVKK